MNSLKICDKVIQYSFLILFFLVPLILTPFNYELFEFNKMMLVYFLTTIIAATWLIKMVINKKIIFRQTFWDIPLLIFLVSQLFSFVISIDRHTSLWGYYSRFHGGLLSTVTYLVLYWAFVSNMSRRDTQDVIRKTLISASLVSLYGIAEHFGIDDQYWVQDVKNRVFSTLGQPNWLAGWLVTLMPLTWSFALKPPPAQRLGDSSFVVALLRLRRSGGSSPSAETGGIRLATDELKSKIEMPSRISFGKRTKTKLQRFFKKILHFRQIQKLLNFESYIYYLLFTIYYLCFLYTKSRSGFLGFAATYLVFWVVIFIASRKSIFRLTRCLTKKMRPRKLLVFPLKQFSIFTFFFLLLTLIIGTPWTPNLGQLIKKPSPSPVVEELSPIPVGGTESGEIRKIVWKGATEIWRHHPLFGTGVETFAYSYYWYRPREHNDVSEWDFLYNKAHNEYLNFAATTGTVGLLAYLGVIGTFLGRSLRKLKMLAARDSFGIKSEKLKVTVKNAHSVRFLRNVKLTKKKLSTLNSNFALCTLHFALFAGYASILVTNFFGFSVVPVALFFFLYPAFAVSLSSPDILKTKMIAIKSKKFSVWQWLAIATILIFTFCILITLGTFWYADFLFARGEKLNKSGWHEQAYEILQKPIAIRPGEPFYHDELALTAANLAAQKFEQNEKELTPQLAEEAISESDNALKISPYHLNFWKNRTRIFHKLTEIDEKYNQGALISLLQAAELAPTDAKVFYNLGLIYAQVGQEETAIKTLEKTIELKPNYRDARYALALFYEQKGDLKETRNQLEYILEKINPQDERVREKLESL